MREALGQGALPAMREALSSRSTWRFTLEYAFAGMVVPEAAALLEEADRRGLMDDDTRTWSMGGSGDESWDSR